MSKIQIKRYNGTSSQWENQFPITKAQHIVATSDGTTAIFDGNDKLKINYLPDAVFDSLYFESTLGEAFSSSSGSLGQITRDAIVNGATNNRSGKGYYWVNDVPNFVLSQSTSYFVDGSTYYAGYFAAGDGPFPSGEGTGGASQGGDGQSSVTLEVGDWVVLTNITGAGTNANPYAAYFSVVSNTYELATTSVNGIVKLSSQTVWADLAGNNVITDARLKALVDGQNYVSASHTHTLSAITDVTATATELNYVDGVTSAIQTQLNAKAPLASPTFSGTVTLPSTTSIGNVSSTELGYLDGVTSAIQTQLNGKQATITGGATTITSSNLTASRALVSDVSGKVAVSSVTSTELGYLSGVTSAVQTQLTNLANRVRVFYDGTPSGMVTDDIWFDAV